MPKQRNKHVNTKKKTFSTLDKRHQRVRPRKQMLIFEKKKRIKEIKKREKDKVDSNAKQPHTIESKREANKNVFQEENEEIERKLDEETFESINDPKYIPKTLITTSKRPSKQTYSFARELIDLFPHSTFIKRGVQFEIDKIAMYCAKRGYSNLIFVNENRKMPDSLTVIHLPSGPSFYFTLSSITPIRCIYQHGRATSHIPELIISNFTTKLGLVVGRMFRSLFPAQPDFEGRQVVTIHNQRDFIFVRRHRYIFKNEMKVGLQELGPQFTLRLRLMQRGIYDKDGNDIIFKNKPGEESNRRRFWLS
ncbi:rRNA-binding ribosome biosynthesis protein RPF1 [Pneumocystis jirovecii RU7]|uniref:Brix domain-containing protein n=1 Tax=Pneumocystis jirovecii (strain RU7) TaxID=1408657 RepID=A0A0W4ZIW7_PNEJ7|nr:rRNA-binding ribosome biosynthesis protein RPF1 [Pneumocystis jirovecii RU7]KTW28317.1 hypothetical protein T551_02736 [Pneumocystis jirovecii RU7]